MNEHVEFTVKAEEDLYLTGSESTIRRVTADTNYSCLMLKTQRFSSLFRHYAKYHGLRKDDLEYYFVNPLENEDTPESVQLQRGDIIMVRKKRKEAPPEPASDDAEFFKDMKELLDDEEHMDTLFLVHRAPPVPKKSGSTGGGAVITAGGKRKKDNAAGVGSSSSMATIKMEMESDTEQDVTAAATVGGSDGDDSIDLIEIRAHKCILTARADYLRPSSVKMPGTTFANQRSVSSASNPYSHPKSFVSCWNSCTPIASSAW